MPDTTKIQKVTNRFQLLSLLSEASEIEHALACSYLFAAFSLKQSLNEGGMTWEQLQEVRKWASQIYFVASEEMLHLAQAWNLLSAIGGSPYYFKPNFPVASKYVSIHTPLALEGFGLASLKRFIYYERPFLPPQEGGFTAEKLGTMLFDDITPEARSVAELYTIIGQAFKDLPEKELFIGLPNRQVGPDLVDFPTLVKVTDSESALAAVNEITEQGEGTQTDRSDCHYGIFLNIYEQLQKDHAFKPARPVLSNPTPREAGNGKPVGANTLGNPYARDVSNLFDDVYSLMLRLLSYVFCNTEPDFQSLREFSQLAIKMMPMVIKPLGESLTLLPAGKPFEGKNAGPSFGLYHPVVLPSDMSTAIRIVREQLADFSQEASRLAADDRAPAPLSSASKHLAILSAGFDL